MVDAWQVVPTVDWLLSKGRFALDLQEFVAGLGARLAEVGAPVSRLRISKRTLHPLLTGYSAFWERDIVPVHELATPHGLEARATYIGSPLSVVAETRKPFRRRLCEGLDHRDHRILHELAAQGATDYYALPLLTSDGRSASMVLSTDRAPGFLDADLAKFDHLAAALAPIVEIFALRRASEAVAAA